MTEKDLDIAIEKCERIMEFDTRTLKNPESENGWIFEKVYELLKFLRQCQFETDGMESKRKKENGMTGLKVIDILERIVEEDWHVYTDDAIEALQIAKKTMEKEIPKKPIEKRIENGDQTQVLDICPFCGSPDIDKECGDYCPKCGQKLVWEEKDD